MNPKCRLYKGVWLDPSSKAYQLLNEKKFKELDANMRECEVKEKALLEKPASR